MQKIDINHLANHRSAAPLPPGQHIRGVSLPPREFRQEYAASFTGGQGAFDFTLLPQRQRLVVIESPFGHPTKIGMDENAAYARKCMLDSLKRGEAPYASHLLYTQCLDDLLLKERKQGMEAGFAWGAAANHVAVYTDRGISGGMLEGIRRHQANGLTIEFRSIA